MKTTTKTLATLVALSAFSVGACTTDPSAPNEPVSTSIGASAKAAVEDTAKAAVKAAEDASSKGFQNAVTFMKALNDDDWATMAPLAATDSPAARYVEHQKISDETMIANGTKSDQDDEQPVVSSDSGKGTITMTYKDKVNTFTVKDFTYDAQGRIETWTGKSGKLDQILWTKDANASASGTTVTLQSGYLSNSGGLVVNLEVTSKHTTNLPYQVSYIDPDGNVRSSSYASTPQTLPAGSKAHATYLFPGAKFGGTLVYQVNSEDYSSSTDLRLPIR